MGNSYLRHTAQIQQQLKSFWIIRPIKNIVQNMLDIASETKPTFDQINSKTDKLTRDVSIVLSKLQQTNQKLKAIERIDHQNNFYQRLSLLIQSRFQSYAKIGKQDNQAFQSKLKIINTNFENLKQQIKKAEEVSSQIDSKFKKILIDPKVKTLQEDSKNTKALQQKMERFKSVQSELTDRTQKLSDKVTDLQSQIHSSDNRFKNFKNRGLFFLGLSILGFGYYTYQAFYKNVIQNNVIQNENKPSDQVDNKQKILLQKIENMQKQFKMRLNSIDRQLPQKTGLYYLFSINFCAVAVAFSFFSIFKHFRIF